MDSLLGLIFTKSQKTDRTSIMNSLHILFIITGLFFSGITDLPDLSKKEDLKSLGTGKIIEEDKSTISKIMLFEVHEYWIVYLKDESLHEMSMDKIQQIEFKDSKWGALEITFPKNKSVITIL